MLKEEKAILKREAHQPLICCFLHYLAQLEHAMDYIDFVMIYIG